MNGPQPVPQDKKQILKARARSLAREAKTERAAEAHLELVEFVLGNERYGIESVFVREVYPLKELTPLPCTPRFVKGIINVRGQILTVIDLKAFFELPDKGISDLNKVLILRAGAMELGILADATTGMRSVLLSDLQPSLPTLTGIRAEYLRGVTYDRLVVLDVEKMLSDEKIVVNEEVGP